MKVSFSRDASGGMFVIIRSVMLLPPASVCITAEDDFPLARRLLLLRQQPWLKMTTNVADVPKCRHSAGGRTVDFCPARRA